MIASQQSQASGYLAEAERAHREGRFEAAIQSQKLGIEALQIEGGSTFQAKKLQSLYYFSAGQHKEALGVLEQLRELAPDDLELMENTGVLLRLLGRQQEAVEFLRVVHERDPKRVNVCDALAHCYANLGDDKNSIRFGSRSLELKDEEAEGRSPICSVPEASPPKVEFDGLKKNVISFSLWGNGLRYLKGALRNAQVAADIYPGWVVRFYCDDSVPLAVRNRLADYGCDVIMKPPPESFFEGLLWRFEVINDPGVGRFLIRDCDSVVNVKERVAVDEWLKSERWFHAMRDFASHTEVILAGMWGGVAGVLPSVDEVLKQFKSTSAPTRTFDQVLLRECVWPVVRQSVIIHDSVYTGTLGSLPFPEVGGLPPGFHIGQNEAAVRPGYCVDFPEDALNGAGETIVVFGLDEESLELTLQLFGRHEGVDIPNTGLREIALAVENYCEGIDAPRVSSLNHGLIAGTVRGLSTEAAHAGRKCLILRGNHVPLGDLVGLGKSEGTKLLCVVRDPVDTLSAAGVVDPSRVEDYAAKWAAVLGRLSQLNREMPGQVEIVRYEDLAKGKRSATVERLCRFAGIRGPVPGADAVEDIRKSGGFPDALLRIVQAKAGRLLKQLRYQ